MLLLFIMSISKACFNNTHTVSHKIKTNILSKESLHVVLPKVVYIRSVGNGCFILMLQTIGSFSKLFVNYI